MTISRRTVLVAMTAAVSGSTEERKMHIALLGDSVIDNQAYIGAGPDVARQLEMLTPKGWKVTKLAQDGAVSASVRRQLDSLPAETTHLVISAGGNDALSAFGLLDASARSAAEVLLKLADVQDRF